MNCLKSKNKNLQNINTYQIILLNNFVLYLNNENLCNVTSVLKCN